MQVCVNGREYLARRMTRAGIGFEQRDNCFVRIDDLPRAQRMMHDLEKRRWERMLNALARRVNPLPGKLNLFGYYWTLRESEYATDVMFRDDQSLAAAYPALVDHAIKRFGCHDVLRFLGRRTSPGQFNGEASASCLRRAEGVRVKHRAEGNSIKMYDRQGSVLRIETTINNARCFRVRRMCVRKGVRRMRWVPMRFGLADLDRRVEVSRAANERCLQALAVVDVPSPARELLDPVSRPLVRERRPCRALRPVSPEDAALFQAALSAAFLIRGFTNRSLRESLGHKPPDDEKQRRRASGKITRQLRLLRAHGLIRKVSGTRCYRVSDQGQRVMTAALKIRDADIAKLAA